MSYTVLARRYRSRTFDQVVGQEHIAKTLRAAIETNRVAHAYLFCGTRGVGKTSMARIFAAALTAPDVIDGVKPHEVLASTAPTDVQQRLADAILAGTDDMDVIEIDGASNNRVEEARDLIAKASILGSGRSRFKIYIIDEVHMLTTAAFNALLKTMEEPPEHVKFILCTTEPQKVLATIKSRCQRFDFRNIPTARIGEHLQHVLDEEKIQADPAVIQHVARLGAGSMRDALSLLDRLIAAGEGKLTPELLEQMLGLPDRTLIMQLIDAAVTCDPGTAITKADELLTRGIAIDQVFEVLIEHLRDLLIVISCGGDSLLLEVGDEERAKIVEQAGHFDTAAVTHMIVLCENAQRSAKLSSTARALFDATMARLAMTQHTADIPRLVEALASGAVGDQKKKLDGDAPSLRTTQTQPTAKPQAAEEAPVPIDDLARVWDRVAQFASRNPSLTGMLSMLELRAIADDRAHIVLLDSPAEAHVRARIGRVEELLAKATGRSLTIELTVDSGGDVAQPEAGLSHEERLAVEKLPLVRQAMDLFGATVIAIHELAEDAPAEPEQGDD
ncbi:MAG: DNA polymerase III subunit gamma/tau [Phycisphaerales bacterium]|nr:DNA polymerase III subunit gamma/tau [Phycisphaerales bacterium]